MNKPATLIAVPSHPDDKWTVVFMQGKEDGKIGFGAQCLPEDHPFRTVKFYLVADGLKIKDNDLVAYTFSADHALKYAGKTFIAEVRTIWKEKNEAGVLAEYGQDIVNLDDCKKVIATPEQIGRSIKDIQSILDNNGKCSVEWEENQCDGCKARIPFNKYHTHQKPNDPTDRFGIGCTAYRYDRPKLIEGKVVIHL